MIKPKDPSRRKFVTDIGLASAGFAIVPRHVLGKGFEAPSDTLNVAFCGVGGQGRSNMINLASRKLVALGEGDWEYANKGLESREKDIKSQQKRLDENMHEFRRPASGGGEKPPLQKRPLTELERARTTAQVEAMTRLKNDHLPRAKRYTDYREMLDRQKDIDAIVVATPDHLHPNIALAAMDLGKHVYVQKPLTWSIAEARALSRRATETKLATQMGNQGHSFDDARTAVEYVWAGAIGDVREIHIWTNRPLGYWPQGVPRPEPLKAAPEPLKWSGRDVNARLAAAICGDYPIPGGLAWDLFQGTCASNVDYHPIYHPFNWRGWTDWGVGAIGDMGAHLIDHTMWALNLGFPTSVETVSNPFNGASYPSTT